MTTIIAMTITFPKAIKMMIITTTTTQIIMMIMLTKILVATIMTWIIMMTMITITTKTTSFLPSVIQYWLTKDINKNIEEYRVPEITIGAWKKGRPYLRDLSKITIRVRYLTHTDARTHKHMLIQHQYKQNKENWGHHSKKKNQWKTRRIINIFSVTFV